MLFFKSLGPAFLPFLFFLLLPACTSQAKGPSSADAPGDGYAIAVTRGGQVLARVSLADLQALPQVSFMVEGKEQRGPTLLSALARAGVQDFQRVTVVGLLRGRALKGDLTLERGEVDERVLLPLNRRGKARLASPHIPAERAIIDIGELKVE